MKKNHLLFYILLCISIISCRKENPTTPVEPETTKTYTVPTTYNFVSADTLASKQRMAMLTELTAYIRITHVKTPHATLDVQKLRDMFVNVNNLFADASLNSSGLQLKNKTAMDLHAALDANFADAAAASVPAAAKPDTTTASPGVAGKLVSISQNRFILVDSAGFEYKEFVEKGIMGGVFYYHGTTLLNTISTFDNVTKANGTTAQERAWDQAFAYFGVRTDFPAKDNSTSPKVPGLKFWGSYCNSVSDALAGDNSNGPASLNSMIMKAWIRGRAAISNKDNAARDEARNTVVKLWEKVVAARFIMYVKVAKINIITPAIFNHNLSEGVGFIRAFKYNYAKTISDADIETLLGYFKTNGNVNLYKVTPANLEDAINKMAEVFGLDKNKL